MAAILSLFQSVKTTFFIYAYQTIAVFCIYLAIQYMNHNDHTDLPLQSNFSVPTFNHLTMLFLSSVTNTINLREHYIFWYTGACLTKT